MTYSTVKIIVVTRSNKAHNSQSLNWGTVSTTKATMDTVMVMSTPGEKWRLGFPSTVRLTQHVTEQSDYHDKNLFGASMRHERSPYLKPRLPL